MLSPIYFSELDSPIGNLTLRGSEHGLSGVFMETARNATATRSGWTRADERLAGPREQLREYFAGARTVFDLTLDLTSGTTFQQRVWAALLTVPYGEAVSYAEIARRIGQPAAVRAVGLANGRNPVAVIVPCHRVIGTNGSLTGYGGGLERKRVLLAHEQKYRPSPVGARADGMLL